jgi:signal-transduction protein with cAMP-binding, CBS, and nucleotidyltransferase domain
VKVREGLRRSGVAVGRETTLRAVAEMMEHVGVGSVVVVDGHVPVGVVTDRDLVRRAAAKGMPFDARVDSVMSSPLVTIDADADLHDAFARFRANGVRRIVVVDGGGFAGVLALDDLLMDVVADLGDLVRPVTAEVLFGHHDSDLPVPA